MKYKLSLPVDIQKLAAEHAEIRFESWPFRDCDALVTGLVDPGRPTIFVRKEAPRRRIRFTLAHELGHVQMGWHLGSDGLVSCHPEASQFDTEQPGRTSVSSVFADWRLREQEAEATRFASYLLIPQVTLKDLARTESMAAVLQGLNEADVSAMAVVIRLSRSLLPGFIFQVEDREGWRQVASSGTAVPAKLPHASIDSGEVVVSDRRVRWHIAADFDDIEPVDDARSTSQILRDAISVTGVPRSVQSSMFLSVNGTVGGVLSQDRAESVVQAYAILKQRFKGSVKYSGVVDAPDFDVYLRRKAYEYISRRGKG